MKFCFSLAFVCALDYVDYPFSTNFAAAPILHQFSSIMTSTCGLSSGTCIPSMQDDHFEEKLACNTGDQGDDGLEPTLCEYCTKFAKMQDRNNFVSSTWSTSEQLSGMQSAKERLTSKLGGR